MDKYLTFALKTEKGYGLIQYHGLGYKYMWPFYIIYRQQVAKLNPEDIKSAMNGEYYYQRIMCITFDKFKLWESGKYLKGKEYTLSEIENRQYSNEIYITYLGEYPLPIGAELPKFSRELDVNYYSGTHCWYVKDEITNMPVCNDKGKLLKYKKLPPEIASYPDYFGIDVYDLLERFNIDFRIEDYNDSCVPEILERKYTDYPDMRPVKISYEEAQKTYPIEEWKENTEGVEDVAGYLAFCGEMESKLKEFTDYIEGGGKSVQKELVKLLKGINKIDEKYHYIESMEAEDLFTYLSKILQSLKKTRLIETIEALREW